MKNILSAERVRIATRLLKEAKSEAAPAPAYHKKSWTPELAAAFKKAEKALSELALELGS